MRFFRLPEISIRLVQAGFLIKVFAGILVGLVYTYYYTDRLTADTFKFFDDSEVLFDSFFSKPGDFFRMFTGIGAEASDLNHYYNKMNNWYDIFSPFNDNRTMIRFNTLVRFFSMGYYFVHVVFICFLSLMGILATVKVFKQEFPKLAMEFYLIMLLLPSVLFWGSGLLKDALVYFSFGMVILTFNNLVRNETINLSGILKFITAALLLLFTKFQVFVLIIPLLIGWWVIYKYKIHALIVFPTTCIIYFGFLLTPLFTNLTGLHLATLLAQKQHAFYELGEIAKAGSVISIPVLEPTAASILMNAPLGFLNALFRPFITDSGPVLTLISSIENTLVLLFGLICIFRFNRKNTTGKILPWFSLFYTLTYFTLIGLITPILGAIVRYKAQALPFLVIMFVMFAATEKENMVKRFISKINK